MLQIYLEFQAQTKQKYFLWVKAALIWFISPYWINRLKQLGSKVYMKLTVVNGVPYSPLLYLNMGVDLSLNLILTQRFKFDHTYAKVLQKYTDCLAEIAL